MVLSKDFINTAYLSAFSLPFNGAVHYILFVINIVLFTAVAKKSDEPEICIHSVLVTVLFVKPLHFSSEILATSAKDRRLWISKIVEYTFHLKSYRIIHSFDFKILT